MNQNSSLLDLNIFIIILMICCNNGNAQNPGIMKTDTTGSAINSSTIEYLIDGKKVSKEKFDKFHSGLKEIEGTWYCAETSGGGETGYDAADKHNVIYEYSTDVDSGKIINSIRRKDLNQ